jgi:hypothetical protein
MEKDRSVSCFVTGLLSLMLCWLPLCGLVLGIIAIILRRRSMTGLGTAGLVLGIIGTITGSIYNIIYFMMFIVLVFAR